MHISNNDQFDYDHYTQKLQNTTHMSSPQKLPFFILVPKSEVRNHSVYGSLLLLYKHSQYVCTLQLLEQVSCGKSEKHQIFEFIFQHVFGHDVCGGCWQVGRFLWTINLQLQILHVQRTDNNMANNNSDNFALIQLADTLEKRSSCRLVHHFITKYG